MRGRAPCAGRDSQRAMMAQVRALKDFLFARMYRHPRVMALDGAGPRRW